MTKQSVLWVVEVRSSRTAWLARAMKMTRREARDERRWLQYHWPITRIVKYVRAE
jgi:hypothetical protein